MAEHILVDLDGTLAEFHGWKGKEHIGKPIKTMVDRVKNWDKRGIEVRIFTARAATPEYIPYVKAWLKEHGLPDCEVVNCKDMESTAIWDDIAVGVKKNTGEPIL